MNDGLLLQGVAASYGRRQILADISCPPLPRGEVAAVLGPNGCGKSTLLKTLAGLLPLHGSVTLDGRALGALPLEARARHVVYLPQSLPPALHLRVVESVMVAANATGLGLASRHAAADIDTLLARLGIAELGMRYLDELSGGQKQLVGLAQALIRQPDVLLLDEPLSALDLNHQCHVMQLVAEETRRRRMVTLVVLHDLNIALHHCHRALLLKHGAVLACGQPANVITPATLASVYGVQSRVEACSRGRLNVLIDGVLA